MRKAPTKLAKTNRTRLVLCELKLMRTAPTKLAKPIGQGLCRATGQPLLFSRAFADHLKTPVTHVARETLKGHTDPSDILTVAP